MNARIQSNPFLTPPTNYVSVVEGNSAVKGSWTIDTSLHPPLSLLAPLPNPDEVRPNLRLDCSNGSINANVRFVEGDGQPRATIHASSNNGSVRIAVVSQSHLSPVTIQLITLSQMSRGKQKVSIRCTTLNGSIKILLPRDYNGLLGYRTHNGSTLFSPAVKAEMTTFSVQRGVGKGFIGDWRGANFTALRSPQQRRPSLDQDAPRSHSLPTEVSATHPHSNLYVHDYVTHGRRPSNASSYGYESPPLPSFPDPEVRVSGPHDENYGYGDDDGSSDLYSAPGRSDSFVSSSTLLPSQSASQVGSGSADGHLHPPNFFSNNRSRSPSANGRRTPISRSTTPSSSYDPNKPLPSPSIISSAPSMNTTLFDEASSAWEGDLIEVETINGTIRIAFVDEPKDHSRTSTLAMGAARFVKGWLAEKGVNTDRFVGMSREASSWVKGT